MRIVEMHPEKEWTVCIGAHPLSCAGNHLISSTLDRLLATITLTLLKTGIVHVKATIEAWRRAISGIK